MHHFRETFGPQSGGSANLTTQRDDIQIAAGLVALLVLMIEPFRPTGQSVGLP